MSSFALVGETQGYGGHCSSPFSGYTLVAGDGIEISIAGATITFTGTGASAPGLSGKQAIPNGASEVAVIFSAPFTAIPTIAGVTVEKDEATDPDVSFWTIKALTTAGFTAVLSGAVPTGNYVLHWEATGGVGAEPAPSPDIVLTADLTTITADSTLYTADAL